MAINGSDKSFSKMEFPLGMKRQDAFPLDDSSVFYSMGEAQTYAQSNPTAYVGQIISVVVDGESTAYQIKDAAGTLEPLGTGDLDEDLDAYFEANTATEQEVQEMLDEIFGSESSGG